MCRYEEHYGESRNTIFPLFEIEIAHSIKSISVRITGRLHYSMQWVAMQRVRIVGTNQYVLCLRCDVFTGTAQSAVFK